MRKLVVLFLVICFAFLFCFTVNAENYDTTLTLREKDTKNVYLDVFLENDNPICAGELSLSVDENYAVFSGIESNCFDVEFCDDNGDVKIIIAKSDGVQQSELEPIFSIKLKTVNKGEFYATLKTEYLVSEDFEKVVPEDNISKVKVVNELAYNSDDFDEEKGAGKSEKSQSTKDENAPISKDADKNSFLPITVDSKNRGVGILLAVGILCVATFLFGLLFKKIMAEKED